MSGEEVDLVATAGELDPVVETLRAFLHDSGAIRAVAIIDGEPGAIIDVGRLAPIEITTGGRVAHMPHAIELEAETLLRPRLQQLPPFDVDAGQGTVIGTMGGLDMIAAALLEIARAFGGESVAMAVFPTTTSDVSLAVTARVGEPVLVSIGDEQFELPD